MKGALSWMLRLLGPCVFLAFLSTIQFQDVELLLRHANLWYIGGALLVMPLFIGVKAWRWQALLRDVGVAVPFATVIGVYTVGLFWGATTPGQAGDLLKAWYLRDRGHSLGPVLLTVVLDRLCDLVVMTVIALWGLLTVRTLLPDPRVQTVMIVLLGGGVLVTTGVLFVRRARTWIITQVIRPLVPPRFHVVLTQWHAHVNGVTLTPMRLVTISITSLLSAWCTFFRLWLLFQALGLDAIPVSAVVSMCAWIVILQIAPLSIGGIGIRDGVLVAALSWYGASVATALGLSLLFVLITLEHIVVGFVVSFWFPLDKRDARLDSPLRQPVRE